MTNITIDKFQFKRGNEANVPSLDSGEPFISEDSHILFVGTPAGNIEFAKKSDVDANTSSLAEKAKQSDLKWININNYSSYVNQTTGSWSPAITQAFSDCIAKNQNLFFPPGTYLVDQTIQMPPHVSVVGSGMKSTFIKLITGATCDIIKFAHDQYSDHFLTDLCVQGDIPMSDSGTVSPPYTGTTQYAGIQVGMKYTDAGMIEGQTLEVNGAYINNVLVQRCYGHGIQVNKRIWIVRLSNLELRQNYGAGLMNYGTDNIFTGINCYQNGYGVFGKTSSNNKYSNFKLYQNGIDPTKGSQSYLSSALNYGGLNLTNCGGELLTNIETQENYTVNINILNCNNITGTAILSDCAGRENIVNSTTYALFTYDLYMSNSVNCNMDIQCTDGTNVSTAFPYTLNACTDCKVNAIGDWSKFQNPPRVDMPTFTENVVSNTDGFMQSLKNQGKTVANLIPSPNWSNLSAYTLTGATTSVSNGILSVTFNGSNNHVDIPLGTPSTTLNSYLLINLTGMGTSTTWTVSIVNSPTLASPTHVLVSFAGALTNSSLQYLKSFINTYNEPLYLRIAGSSGTIGVSFAGVVDSTFYGKNLGMTKAYNMMMRNGLLTTNIIG